MKILAAAILGGFLSMSVVGSLIIFEGTTNSNVQACLSRGILNVEDPERAALEKIAAALERSGGITYSEVLLSAEQIEENLYFHGFEDADDVPSNGAVFVAYSFDLCVPDKIRYVRFECGQPILPFIPNSDCEEVFGGRD